MARITDLLDYLDGLLEPARFDDYGPNGLQVPGRAEITTVATGVSAHSELFTGALDAGADLVLVHHGLFWDGHSRALTPVLAARLKLLLEAGVGLAAYHLPLDAHPLVGNNALIAAGLGATVDGPFAEHRGAPIGVVARFPGDGVPARELFERVRELTAREPLRFDAGPERVCSIGLVSGAAAGDLAEAIDLGLDAFLTGEPAEHVMADAREAGIHFIAAGHYATETFGIRALGDRLTERFGVRHVALDVPNPI